MITRSLQSCSNKKDFKSDSICQKNTGCRERYRCWEAASRLGFAPDERAKDEADWVIDRKKAVIYDSLSCYSVYQDLISNVFGVPLCILRKFPMGSTPSTYQSIE